MKNTHKGSVLPVVIIVIVVILAGAVYYISQFPQASEDASMGTASSTDTSRLNTNSSVDSATTATAETKAPSPTSDAATQKQPSQTLSTDISALASTPKKNIYTNSSAGYSIELPENWSANVNAAVKDPNEPEITGTFLSIKGKTVDEQGFSFDIQTATTKHHIDYYKQQYSRTPTNDDLFNLFIETQKSSQDDFKIQSTRKTVINGNQAYEVNATISGGAAIEKLYAFYTSKNTFYIQIIGFESRWKEIESELLKVVSSFKIQ